MHPNDGRVVSNFIVQALTGQDITIYGNGDQTRAFCYIDDLLDGLVRMMETDDDILGPVNLGNPHEISIRQLAELVIEMCDSRSRIVSRPLPQDDPTQRCPDITRAEQLLGWKPQVPLVTGIPKTIAYFDQLLGTSKSTKDVALTG